MGVGRERLHMQSDITMQACSNAGSRAAMQVLCWWPLWMYNSVYIAYCTAVSMYRGCDLVGV
jgi:hypothetical protein